MEILHSPSPNFGERPAGSPINTLVLHYTGMQTVEAALHRLTDAEAKVSAHYVVDEDGVGAHGQLGARVDEPLVRDHAERPEQAEGAEDRGGGGLAPRQVGVAGTALRVEDDDAGQQEHHDERPGEGHVREALGGAAHDGPELRQD